MEDVQKKYHVYNTMRETKHPSRWLMQTRNGVLELRCTFQVTTETE